MTLFLLIIAVCVGGLGLLFLTGATAGVGIIGLACLIGIVARLIQADSHHHKLMKHLQRNG